MSDNADEDYIPGEGENLSGREDDQEGVEEVWQEFYFGEDGDRGLTERMDNVRRPGVTYTTEVVHDTEADAIIALEQLNDFDCTKQDTFRSTSSLRRIVADLTTIVSINLKLRSSTLVLG